MENVETRDSCIVCLNSPTERKPQNSESRVFFFFFLHIISVRVLRKFLGTNERSVLFKPSSIQYSGSI